MIQEIIAKALISLVYLCVAVVVFSPTIYVTWMYVVGRKLSRKRDKGLRKLALITFCINVTAAYVLLKLAFDFFLTSKVHKWQASAQSAIQSAITAQKRFFNLKGRYYSVGPVRGPYKDAQGLVVEKDVILLVIPYWDQTSRTETFQAYAVHVLVKRVLSVTKDGKEKQLSEDSEESLRIQSKLLGSVK